MNEKVNEHNKSSVKIIIFQESPKSLMLSILKLTFLVPHSYKNYLYLIHIQNASSLKAKVVYTLCEESMLKPCNLFDNIFLLMPVNTVFIFCATIKG